MRRQTITFNAIIFQDTEIQEDQTPQQSTEPIDEVEALKNVFY